ncbi:MAG TPA: TIR domain-containing protein [Pyrinomonadaceae bacterium]|nr:TIR domain-containing protein [Pyrinomonadaceae bacterium]
MANVFISYNRKSRAIVESLEQDLAQLGETAWFDEDLSGGQSWWNAILGKIRGCDLFVFVLDPESLNSAACKSEYKYAADLGKPILPILVSDRVSAGLLPPALSQIQFVDYRVQNRKTALQLARAMTTIPPPPPLPDPLPAPPEVPISYLGKLTTLVDTEVDLTFEQQTNLVFQLKRGLNDPGMVQDTCTLLDRLRRRRELLATVAAEIDDLLRGAASSATEPEAIKTNALDSQDLRKRDSPGTIGTEAGFKPGTASYTPSGNLGGSHPPPGYSLPPPQQHAPQIPNNLVWAVVALFCCWPLAIVSIINAAQVNQKVAAGDFAGAMAASKKAKTWAIVAVIGGATLLICYLIVLMIMAAASQNTRY